MDADGSGAIDADELGAAFKVCQPGPGVEPAGHSSGCLKRFVF